MTNYTGFKTNKKSTNITFNRRNNDFSIYLISYKNYKKLLKVKPIYKYIMGISCIQKYIL